MFILPMLKSMIRSLQFQSSLFIYLFSPSPRAGPPPLRALTCSLRRSFGGPRSAPTQWEAPQSSLKSTVDMVVFHTS